jgi:hypothetical protein
MITDTCINSLNLSKEPVSASSTKYKCLICKKEYSRKASIDKHRILCDFKSKSKIELIVEQEESSDKPTLDQLIKIVQEMAIKQAKMETKMEEMQQYINRKKQKLDVITRLNTTVNATIGFLEWITMTIQVSTADFEYLFENTVFQTYQYILEKNLCNPDPKFVFPIRCFKDKPNHFYICEKGESDNVSLWREAEATEITQLLKKIHNLLLASLTKWKQDNKEKIADNDRLSDQFNKAVIKLMNISFTADGIANVNRIKNALYTYLKEE